MTLVYDNKDCNQFVQDMEEAGYEVEHYRGRFYWEGPACRTTDDYGPQDIVRATKVRLQNDSMGLGTIWYPIKSGKQVEEKCAEADLKEEGLLSDIHSSKDEKSSW